MVIDRIQTCINALKGRLENNGNSLVVQLENGSIERRSFTFNPPTTKENIQSFFEKNSWSIPNDYFSFLLFTTTKITNVLFTIIR